MARRAVSGAALSAPYLKGGVDEVCVFSRALGREEVARLAGRAGPGDGK